MSNNYTQSSIGYQLSEEEMQLNQELNLVLPDGVLTEDIPQWHAFFSMLRFTYTNDMLTKEDILQHIQLFAQIPNQKKFQALKEFDQLIARKVEEIHQFDRLVYRKELTTMVDEAITHLSEEQKLDILSQIASGDFEDLTPDVIGIDLTNDLDPFTVELVQKNLSRALDKRNRLRADKLSDDSIPKQQNVFQKGTPLTNADLEKRFALNDSPQPKQNPPIRPNPPTTQSQPIRPIPQQPLRQPPQINQTILPPRNPQSRPRAPLPQPGQKAPNKPAGLDELLKK